MSLVSLLIPTLVRKVLAVMGVVALIGGLFRWFAASQHHPWNFWVIVGLAFLLVVLVLALVDQLGKPDAASGSPPEPAEERPQPQADEPVAAEPTPPAPGQPEAADPEIAAVRYGPRGFVVEGGGDVLYEDTSVTGDFHTAYETHAKGDVIHRRAKADLFASAGGIPPTPPEPRLARLADRMFLDIRSVGAGAPSPEDYAASIPIYLEKYVPELETLARTLDAERELTANERKPLDFRPSTGPEFFRWTEELRGLAHRLGPSDQRQGK